MSPQWLAGWFEARGHLIVSAREARCGRSGNMVRSDRFGLGVCGPAALVRALLANFGGRAYPGRTRDGHHWRAYGKEAAALLATVLPHVVTRRDELEAGWLFSQTLMRRRGARSVPGALVRRREELARKIDGLRQRRKGYARERALRRAEAG